MAGMTYSRSAHEMDKHRRTMVSARHKKALFDLTMSPEDVHEAVGKAVRGAGWDDFADAFKHGPDHFFNRLGNEVTNKDSDLRGKIIPAAVNIAEKVAPIIPGAQAVIDQVKRVNAIDTPHLGAGSTSMLTSTSPSRLRELRDRKTQLMAGRGKTRGVRVTKASANSTMAGSGKRSAKAGRKPKKARAKKGKTPRKHAKKH